MKAIGTKSALLFISFSLLIYSCSKKDFNPGVESKMAMMKTEITCMGDIQSQVVLLTFFATNTWGELTKIGNDSTGHVTSGPCLQKSDLSHDKIISFHSACKVNSVNVTVAISPKIYATTTDQLFALTIKIYFDDKLKDNQTFSYDQLFDGTSTTPKNFDYKVTVN